jgi:hypothetical protein
VTTGRLESINTSRGGVPKTSVFEALVACVLAAVLGSAAACTRTASAAPKTLTVASKDYLVSGEYANVLIDRVDGLKVERGRLVVKGQPQDVEVAVPAADLERAARHWALVTDAHLDGHRLLVFTEAESVKDVSIELPDGEASIHFDVFAARGGGEILIFAPAIASSAEPIRPHDKASRWVGRGR